jgi:type I restriction enzyme M protein
MDDHRADAVINEEARITITTFEIWLWEAACSVGWPLDASKHKDYILPLLFYKHLSGVFKNGVGD